MDTPPIEVDVDVVARVGDFDAPKLLRFEVSYSLVAVNNEAERWELTRA